MRFPHSAAFLVAGGILAALIFVLLAGYGVRVASHPRTAPAATSTQEGGVPLRSFGNAFVEEYLSPLPQIEREFAIPSFSVQPSSATAKARMNKGTLPYTETAPRQSSTVSTLPLSSSNLLQLPSVTDAEIAVDPSGARNLAAYLEYFVSHDKEIRFPQNGFDAALKTEGGAPFLPLDLVEVALNIGNFNMVHASLAAMREFVSAKIEFLKSIKVYGAAVGVSKTMIAMDRLTLQLIDKAFAVEQGTLTRAELEDFFQKYKATATFSHEEFEGSYGGLSWYREESFFDKVADTLGLRPLLVRAAMVPFGGPIILTIPCSCSLGVGIKVGPPKGGTFYLSVAFQASPAFFPFKAVHPKAFILGNYTPASIPCNALPACATIIPGVVTMAGTSE